MLNRKDVKRILSDLLRTEAARSHKDALAVFGADQTGELFSRLPPDVLETVFDKAAVLFGYSRMKFSSLEFLTDYSYASFLKNGKIIFQTSGSTGAPKPCVHSKEMIWEEAFGTAALFKGIKRVVSLVPANHLYGFSFTVAMPHVLEANTLSLPALPVQPWNELLKEGDLIAGFPLFWEYWLRCGNRFPQGVEVLSSTAPCKDETILGLYAAGAKRFTEIYGASETGAIGHRHQAGKAFELFPFWEISSEDGHARIKRVSQEQWTELPDRVEIQNERFVRPQGRLDACVQVAGINVYPKRVERVLGNHPAVKACKVRLMRPEEGVRLKAFIVLNEGYGPDSLDEIRSFLSKSLTVHERPRSFTFGPELPVSSLGKDADW